MSRRKPIRKKVAVIKQDPVVKQDPVPSGSKAQASTGKPRLELIPLGPLLQVAKALEDGAVWYGEYDWRTAPDVRASRYLGACLRHLASWQSGEDVEPGSGKVHLAAAVASLLVLMDAQVSASNFVDDRP